MEPADPRTRFALDTAVRPLGGGRYEADVDRSWWIVNGPNGGYVAALLLRAVVDAAGGDGRRPRTLHVQYLRAPGEGPADVEVVVERAGRSVTNASVRMHQDGRLLVIALASLGLARATPVAYDEDPGLPLLPDGSPVPVPEDVPHVPIDPERDVPMRRHYDLRWVLGEPPFQGGADRGGRARCGGWLRPAEPEPVDEVVLAAMSDAWLPPIFSRIDHPLAVPTVDLTVHFRGLPADPLDHCFVDFAAPVARDGYLVEHGRILSRDGVLLAESRQLAVVA